ncbi:MAG: GNAT family N-acetyltransferase [Candidatus ainarchaeum sp.]|nr:GNAT family N-acetyltransferase [Candidatus ainarchaeum sp.]
MRTKLPVQRSGNQINFEFRGEPISVPNIIVYSGYANGFKFVNCYVIPKTSRLLIIREMHAELSPGYHQAIFLANAWEGNKEVYIGAMDRKYVLRKGEDGIAPHGGVLVKPEYRREGIGSLLDYFSRKLLISKGITKFEVVLDHTPQAEPFAKFTGKSIKKKMGF